MADLSSHTGSPGTTASRPTGPVSEPPARWRGGRFGQEETLGDVSPPAPAEALPEEPLWPEERSVPQYCFLHSGLPAEEASTPPLIPSACRDIVYTKMSVQVFPSVLSHIYGDQALSLKE